MEGGLSTTPNTADDMTPLAQRLHISTEALAGIIIFASIGFIFIASWLGLFIGKRLHRRRTRPHANSCSYLPPVSPFPDKTIETPRPLEPIWMRDDGVWLSGPNVPPFPVPVWQSQDRRASRFPPGSQIPVPSRALSSSATMHSRIPSVSAPVRATSEIWQSHISWQAGRQPHSIYRAPPPSFPHINEFPSVPRRFSAMSIASLRVDEFDPVPMYELEDSTVDSTQFSFNGTSTSDSALGGSLFNAFGIWQDLTREFADPSAENSFSPSQANDISPPFYLGRHFRPSSRLLSELRSEIPPAPEILPARAMTTRPGPNMI